MKQRIFFIQILIGIILLGSLLGCKPKLFPAKYVSWVMQAQNGLVKDTTVKQYRFKLQYHPLEQMMLKELDDVKHIDKKDFKAKKQEMAGLQYYVLQITPLNENMFPGLDKNSNQKTVFEEEINYFSFDMQQDLKLVQAGDTLSCVSFTHDRTFRHAPYYSFLLVFEDKQTTVKENRTLIYTDRKLGVGTIQFQFKASDLNRIPRLKTKK